MCHPNLWQIIKLILCGNDTQINGICESRGALLHRETDGFVKEGKNGSSESWNMTPPIEHWLHSLDVDFIHHTETNRAALRRCCINMTAPQGRTVHFCRAKGGKRDKLARKTVYLELDLLKETGRKNKIFQYIIFLWLMSWLSLILN